MKTFSKFIVGLLVIGGLFIGGLAITNKTEAPEVNSFGACAGSECTQRTTFRGGLQGSFFSEGGGMVTVATTSATYTLTEQELNSGNVIYIQASTTAAALSLTLPATSTLTTILPRSGDARKWYIENAHTSAATTTTILAGTGIELQGDGTGSDVINGGVWGAMECYREPTTNITCVVHEYVAAD